MSVYPAINAMGVITQFDYAETDEWVVTEVSMPNGMSYTSPQSSERMKRFRLSYPAITRAEAKVVEEFFIEMRGRYGEFEFTDDDGLVWHSTRFDTDTLEVQYVGINHCSLVVPLSAEPEEH